MRYHCCDQRRLEVAASRAASANGIEFLEVLDHAAPPGAPRQRTLFVRLLRPGSTLTPDNVRIDGGERIRTVGVEWVRRRPTPCRRRPSPALVDARRRPAAHAGRPHRQRRRLLAPTRCASSPAPAATSRPPASTRCSSPIEFSFKVECPTDFDCAPAAAPARRSRAPARHRLPRQGLQRLPPADARPAEPARAGLDASARPPTSASRWSSCWPTSPTPLATARTRSPPRPTSPPRASASRCAATRGWSTTACTRAATRAPGCTSRSAARPSLLPQGTPAADRARRTCRP